MTSGSSRRLVVLLCLVTAIHCQDARHVHQDPTHTDPKKRPAQLNAVRGWTRFVLQREAPATRLFVESYFMRGLVAAAELLAVPTLPSADHALADSAFQRAQAFADSLQRNQDASGYWKLGYSSGWVADMAAAVAMFGSLEPHATAERLTAYEQCADKYLRGLERDGLILESGGVGLGSPLEERSAPGTRVWRSDIGWSDSEYLVSTALAGIEVNAWMYHRTHAETYRARSRKALDVTFLRLKSDGSFPTVGPQEGPLQVALYVHEGWIAAATWLEDSSVATRICSSSVTHLESLIAAQQPDGTWTSPSAGDAVRTDGLVGFLVWHEAHCEANPHVEHAVERSRRFLLQPRHWNGFGISTGGDHDGELSEIRRALAGRAIVAVVRGQPAL